MKFDVIIVVYNKSVCDIVSLTHLENDSRVAKIVVCDNSDASNNNAQEVKSHKNLEYLYMNGNKGLSTAYNCAVNFCNSPYICMLDDDTVLPEDFFEKAAIWCKENADADILLPLVYSEERLLSPCRNEKGWFHSFESAKEISGDFSGINSGMIIKRCIFDNYRYDQKLFLDYIDHSFICDMRKANKKILVMNDIVLKQSFSRKEYNLESEKARFVIFKKDFRQFYSKSKLDRLKAERMLFNRKLELMKKYQKANIIWI